MSMTLLNICGLATSIFDPVLGLGITTATSPPTISICICIYIATNYF